MSYIIQYTWIDSFRYCKCNDLEIFGLIKSSIVSCFSILDEDPVLCVVANDLGYLSCMSMHKVE